ncbi:DUF6232 family protein [Polymorphospora lycopeni]|uniref:DUF6232 family protein n=1 Tax=Polymorphospora lycopeni TaxID=3140240 RepID=A0ABV5CZU8_9ACTN
MITYYRDRAVQVTSEAIRVGPRAYPLDSLTRVWHQRGTRNWRMLAGRGAIGVAMAGPLVAAAFGIAVAVQLRASVTVTIAVVAASVLVGLAVGPLADLLLGRLDRSYERGVHDLEIWAEVRGAPVLLVHTPDAARFGRIYRALQRALEAPPAPRPSPGRAGPPVRRAPGPASVVPPASGAAPARRRTPAGGRIPRPAGPRST